MILFSGSLERPAPGERPTCQWEASRDPHAHTLRLSGRLRARELGRVIEAILERGRSPRDRVMLDFELVEHVDYRAIPEFAASVARQRDRGAVIWLTGLSAYVRRLFDVSGQGPTLRRILWMDEGDEAAPRRVPLGLDPSVASRGRAHRAWQ